MMCKSCRWEYVVIRGNSSKLRGYKDIQKLRARAVLDPKLKKVLFRKTKKERNEKNSNEETA